MYIQPWTPYKHRAHQQPDHVKTLPLQSGVQTMQEKGASVGRENGIGAEAIKQLGIILDSPNMCNRRKK